MSPDGKVLGLTINRTGISKHIENVINKGKAALIDLFRFRSLPTKIKTHQSFYNPYYYLPFNTTSNNQQSEH